MGLKNRLPSPENLYDEGWGMQFGSTGTLVALAVFFLIVFCVGVAWHRWEKSPRVPNSFWGYWWQRISPPCLVLGHDAVKDYHGAPFCFRCMKKLPKAKTEETAAERLKRMGYL